VVISNPVRRRFVISNEAFVTIQRIEDFITREWTASDKMAVST
jgi:hypothetical protein